MKSLIVPVGMVILAFGCAVQAQTYAAIDYPGAAQTYLGQINDLGQAVGFAMTAGGSVQYFILDTKNGYVPFELDLSDPVLVLLSSINNSGDMAGMYWDSNDFIHGFLRDSSGAITPIDYPDVIETYVTSINNRGQIAGFYGASRNSTNYGTYGFLYERGAFTPVEHPREYEMEIMGVSDTGEIAGAYWNGESTRGFLRDPKGQYVDIVYPGAAVTRSSISPGGAIMGYYSFKPDRNPWIEPHGFYLAKDGSFVILDPPGSVYNAPSGMNRRGQITGTYWDASGMMHGYLAEIPRKLR